MKFRRPVRSQLLPDGTVVGRIDGPVAEILGVPHLHLVVDGAGVSVPELQAPPGVDPIEAFCLRMLEQAERLSSTQLAWLHRMYGEFLETCGRRKEALEHYRAALRHDDTMGLKNRVRTLEAQLRPNKRGARR
jgi:hypothetical protein